MPNYIVLRLHPPYPMSGSDFRDHLTNLSITATELLFNPPTPALEWQTPSANTDIIQLDNGSAPPTYYPVATAVIELTSGHPEYRTSDVVITMRRNGNQIAPATTHYNVQLLTSASAPARNPPTYDNLEPVAAYLPVPGPGAVLDPSLPSVDLPQDGNPPNFDQLRAAVEAVLAQDPGSGWSLTWLTVPQCLHIANELVWNRDYEPPPSPMRDIEVLYTPEDNVVKNAERQQFEAETRGYYAFREATAQQLARYIYSLSAAIRCSNMTDGARQALLRYPIQPAGASTGALNEAEVTLIS